MCVCVRMCLCIYTAGGSPGWGECCYMNFIASESASDPLKRLPSEILLPCLLCLTQYLAHCPLALRSRLWCPILGDAVLTSPLWWHPFNVPLSPLFITSLMEHRPLLSPFQALGGPQRSKVEQTPPSGSLDQGCHPWISSFPYPLGLSPTPEQDVSWPEWKAPQTHAPGCSMGLTDDLHGGQVYPDLLEAGEPGCCVVLPTLTVITPAPVVGAFGWVVQPTRQREYSGEDGEVFLGISRWFGLFWAWSSPTCARKPQRNSQSRHGPVSHTPWGGQSASLHRRPERQTRQNLPGEAGKLGHDSRGCWLWKQRRNDDWARTSTFRSFPVTIRKYSPSSPAPFSLFTSLQFWGSSPRIHKPMNMSGESAVAANGTGYITHVHRGQRGANVSKINSLFQKRAGKRINNETCSSSSRKVALVGWLTVIDIVAGFPFFWLQVSGAEVAGLVVIGETLHRPVHHSHAARHGAL